MNQNFRMDVDNKLKIQQFRPCVGPHAVVEAFGVCWFPRTRGILLSGDYWRTVGWNFASNVREDDLAVYSF